MPNNILIEAPIGAIILVIVGLLGTLLPALHDEVAGMAHTGLYVLSSSTEPHGGGRSGREALIAC